MKAAAFDYVRPATLRQVCACLADPGAEARIIAGGQSLVPMMAMRLVRPKLLVDINEVAGLAGIAREGNELVIGAATRQCDALRAAAVAADAPLLARALPFVGHDQTRNRGTIGGSLAQADPSAEIGLVAAALGAAIAASDGAQERRIAAEDFFLGPMTTALRPEECLTALRLPVWTEGRIGTGFQEVSARDSDFAIVAAAAQLAFDEAGTCRRAAIAVANAAPLPLRLARLEEALVGHPVSEERVRRLAALLDEAIEPPSDLHASAEARRHMARTLVTRAVLQAARSAGGR